MIDEWFYNIAGEDQGPVSLVKLRKLVARGRLKPETKVWRWDTPSPRPISEVAELRGLLSLGERPPSLTPQPTPRNVAANGWALLWWRFLAFLIDMVVSIIIAGLVIRIFNLDTLLQAMTGWNRKPCDQLLLGIAQWLYFAFYECSATQATPGKRALGLRVIRIDGRPVSFLRASNRYLSKWLSVAAMGIGVLMVTWTKNRQMFHDWSADCQVLTKKEALRKAADAAQAAESLPATDRPLRTL
jgi:uncharacterized RDD family membrane protein YckC